MTEIQEMAVRNYLKGLTFGDKEFYEEMYDHICSAYENREEASLTVREFIALVIQPNFGGKAGLRKVYEAQARQRKRMVYKRAVSLFGAYLFRWPTVLVTALLFLILLQLNQLFDEAKVFEICTMIGLVTPFLLAQYGKWRFKQQCKKHRLPYDSSQVNDTVHFLSIAGVALLYGFFSLISRWILGERGGFLDFFSQYPVSFLPVSMLLLVYALVCLQLFKEKFQLKLT